MRKHDDSLDALLLSKQMCSGDDDDDDGVRDGGEVSVQPITVGNGASFQGDDYRVDVVMNADSIDWTFRDNDGKVVRFERHKIGAMPAAKAMPTPTMPALSRAQRRRLNRDRGRNRA